MSQIFYQINSGYPNFTAHIEPNVAEDQIHSSTGIYSFDDIPAGNYSITITDAIGCEAFFDNISITTTTTTTLIVDLCADCYGVEYNYYAAVDPRGLAPIGWRVPTLTDFNNLILYLDPFATVDPDYHGYGKDMVYSQNENVVFSLRRTGNITWVNNEDATNTTGFCSVGTGYRAYCCDYVSKDEVCELMSQTLSYTSQWVVNLYIGGGSNANPTPSGYTPEIFTNYEREISGMAIRCIKEDDVDPFTVTDYDGNVYDTVKIGSQVWMKQNLKVQHYNNGDYIPQVTDFNQWKILSTGACCVMENNWDNACVNQITPITTSTTSTTTTTTTTTP